MHPLSMLSIVKCLYCSASEWINLDDSKKGVKIKIYLLNDPLMWFSQQFKFAKAVDLSPIPLYEENFMLFFGLKVSFCTVQLTYML